MATTSLFNLINRSLPELFLIITALGVGPAFITSASWQELFVSYLVVIAWRFGLTGVPLFIKLYGRIKNHSLSPHKVFSLVMIASILLVCILSPIWVISVYGPVLASYGMAVSWNIVVVLGAVTAISLFFQYRRSKGSEFLTLTKIAMEVATGRVILISIFLSVLSIVEVVDLYSYESLVVIIFALVSIGLEEFSRRRSYQNIGIQ